MDFFRSKCQMIKCKPTNSWRQNDSYILRLGKCHPQNLSSSCCSNCRVVKRSWVNMCFQHHRKLRAKKIPRNKSWMRCSRPIRRNFWKLVEVKNYEECFSKNLTLLRNVKSLWVNFPERISQRSEEKGSKRDWQLSWVLLI